MVEGVKKMYQNSDGLASGNLAFIGESAYIPLENGERTRDLKLWRASFLSSENL